MAERVRPAWAMVDLDAIRHNVRTLAAIAAPARLCAVVKADGYGHGAVPVARAAVDAGAAWLAVALVEEGVTLRDAGIDVPILLLSEPPPAGFGAVVARGLTPTIYSRAGAEALVTAAGGGSVSAHVKVDTGMHRVGAEPAVAVEVARFLQESGVVVEGLWTHFAVADEPDRDFTSTQLDRFEGACTRVEAAGVRPLVLHAANSAATLAHPRSHRDLVRCGISIYGYDPVGDAHPRVELRPAMSLVAEVSHVRTVEAGEGISYGLRYVTDRRTVIATVPLGYADGVPRRLSAVGGQALVGGRRCPIAGTVTMDQLLVDCGPDTAVARGDQVVLLGRQGDEELTADDWAGPLDTISYEILCGISPRVPRVHVG